MEINTKMGTNCQNENRSFNYKRAVCSSIFISTLRFTHKIFPFRTIKYAQPMRWLLSLKYFNPICLKCQRGSFRQNLVVLLYLLLL